MASILSSLTLHLFDLKTEIGPIKTGNKGDRLPETQLGDDITADIGSGRRCQGGNRRMAQFFNNPFETKVIGTKIVPPFGNAVGLINGKEGDAAGLNPLHESRDSETAQGRYKPAYICPAESPSVSALARKGSMRC